MYEVRIFDGMGELKRVVTVAEIIAGRDEALRKPPTPLIGNAPKFKPYICDGCRVTFESNARQGAKYCPKCRLNATKRWKKRQENL